jgi:glycosyltransferase involved in cell wall biosynthesis
MIDKTLPKVLHISFARKYDYSFLPTWRKRLSLATGISKDYVVQGVRDRQFRSFHDVAHTYYIPYWFPRYLQYVVDCLLAFGAVLYFGIRRGVVIILSHDPYVAIPVLVAKWVLKALGRSVVVIVEALGDWQQAPFLDGFLPQSLRKPLSKIGDFAFKHADITRANSPFTAAKIRQITDNPCITLPPYAELSLFLADAESAVQPHHSQVILYAGVLSFRKGVHILVQAFAQLAPQHPEASLFIIGEGEYREEIVRLIHASGIPDKIRLLPFVSQKELKQHIDSCAMVVLPSFSEGLGRILLEAMACGRPVIVSAIDAVKELITDGLNGLLVKPGDVQALAAQIEKLLQTPELASEVGRRGKQLVQDQYSETAFIRGYRSLIEAAIQQLPTELRKPFIGEVGRQW